MTEVKEEVADYLLSWKNSFYDYPSGNFQKNSNGCDDFDVKYYSHQRETIIRS